MTNSKCLFLSGIDVQAELRAKTGSPSLGPTHMPQNMAQPPTVQRAIMNRHQQARRSVSNIAPKLEPGTAPATLAISRSNVSPQSHQTSHHSSPTINSPGFSSQGVMTPPASDSHIQLQQQRNHQQQLKAQIPRGVQQQVPGIGAPIGSGPKGHGSGGTASMGGMPAAYYPAFQNHIEQLGKLTRPLLSNFFT